MAKLMRVQLNGRFAMKPSDIGLAVYRHLYLSEEFGWVLGGFALAIPNEIDSEKDRYKLAENMMDEEGGVAVYLFNSDAHRSQFTAGLYASGDDLKGWAASATNLGCPGLIREFGTHEAFEACTRSNDFSNIAVFDYRSLEDVTHSQDIPSKPLPIFHRNSKFYGGAMAASPEFMLCLIDQRAEKGEAAMGMWPSADASGEGQIIISAGLETMPGGARTVPHIKVNHRMNQRQLFRLYKHSAIEYMLIPDSNVKFRPHLMTNGSMGFIVSDET